MQSIPELQSLDEALLYIDGLQRSGYEQLGNWSLGQNCNHLAQSVDLTLSGPFRFMPRVIQKVFFGAFLAVVPLGRIGARIGLRIPTVLPQREPVDDAVGVASFSSRVRELQDRGATQQMAFHLWHCCHHLSFLVPKPAPVPESVDQPRTTASVS